MPYDSWPKTSVPVPAGKFGSSCEPCEPGYGVLMGPGRDSVYSHTFTVGAKPVVLRGVGFCDNDGVTACLEMEIKSCGEVMFEPVKINGAVCCIDSMNNVMTVTGSGRYRVVLTGADPEDVWVTQDGTDTKMVMGVPTIGEKAGPSLCDTLSGLDVTGPAGG